MARKFEFKTIKIFDFFSRLEFDHLATENVTSAEFEEYEIETKENVLQEIQNLSKIDVPATNPDPSAPVNSSECEFDPNLEIKTEVEEVVTNEMTVKMSSGKGRTVTIREGLIIPNILKEVVWANEGDDEPLEPLGHSTKAINEESQSFEIEENPGFSDDEWTIKSKSKKKKNKKKKTKSSKRGLNGQFKSQMPLGNHQLIYYSIYIMDSPDTVITRRHALLLTLKSKIKGIPSDDSTKSRFLVGTDTRKTYFFCEKISSNYRD